MRGQSGCAETKQTTRGPPAARHNFGGLDYSSPLVIVIILASAVTAQQPPHQPWPRRRPRRRWPRRRRQAKCARRLALRPAPLGPAPLGGPSRAAPMGQEQRPLAIGRSARRPARLLPADLGRHQRRELINSLNGDSAGRGALIYPLPSGPQRANRTLYRARAGGRSRDVAAINFAARAPRAARALEH